MLLRKEINVSNGQLLMILRPMIKRFQEILLGKKINESDGQLLMIL